MGRYLSEWGMQVTVTVGEQTPELASALFSSLSISDILVRLAMEIRGICRSHNSWFPIFGDNQLKHYLNKAFWASGHGQTLIPLLKK